MQQNGYFASNKYVQLYDIFPYSWDGMTVQYLNIRWFICKPQWYQVSYFVALLLLNFLFNIQQVIYPSGFWFFEFYNEKTIDFISLEFSPVAFFAGLLEMKFLHLYYIIVLQNIL